MKNIEVLGLLSSYRTWVKKGEIQFLKRGSEDQAAVLECLTNLISDFQEASGKPGELSANLNWHEAHKKGVKLWQKLLSCSLSFIDKGSKGRSELFKFLDSAINFEDLLYGLEDYYRDHTLHSLWVYLIGEFILREMLPEVRDELNWYFYNDIERDLAIKASKVRTSAKKHEKLIRKDIDEQRDAIWCLTALCHDLGYSLSKLDALNKKARDVLKFFSISQFKQIGYALDIEHQYATSQFLELMAADVRIVPTADKNDFVTKCYRDDSTYWQLCRALERREHGILSAYLIYKVLDVFGDSWLRGPGEEWGLGDEEIVDNIIRGDILFAIAQHSFEYAHVREMGGLAELLILADEVEEFSRYGRQLFSREYHDTTAECHLGFSIKKNTKEIEIKIVYDVRPHQSLSDFFKRKAEQLCKFYSLEEIDEDEKQQYYRIRRIEMSAKQNGSCFSFCLTGEATNPAVLPRTKIDTKEFSAGKYPCVCQDDKLYVEIDQRRIELTEWLKHAVI